MHSINGAYTSYINRKKKRSGHLFQGRYKAIVVDKDHYLLELSRYIHLNPVRAGMVERPDLYPYSSYKGYVSSIKDEIVDCNLILSMFSKKKAKSKYRQFVENSEAVENPFEEVYGGMALGSPDFIRELLAKIKEDRLEKGDISRRRELMSSLNKDRIIDAVAHYYKLDKQAIFEGVRNPFKKISIYLLKRHTSASNPEIGSLFKLSYSGVAKVYQRLSNQLKEDKKLKREITKIESILSYIKG